MAATHHPLLDQADDFLAALLAFEAAIPEPSPDAGKIDDAPMKIPWKKRKRPQKGVVYVPGSGQHVDQNVATITDHAQRDPSGGIAPTNSGPNTHSLEGLPNSGGGGGGGW